MQAVKNVYSVSANGDDAPCVVVLSCGRRMEMNCSPKQFIAGYKKYIRGELVQNAFPFLNAGEREFLITGLTPSMWEQIFGSDEQ